MQQSVAQQHLARHGGHEMAFDWSALMGSAQRSKNNALYGALLGAQGANDPNAAMRFLNDPKMNPMTMESTMGNRPGFMASNPNWINPKGFSASSLGSAAGTTSGNTNSSFDLSTAAGNKAAMDAFSSGDWAGYDVDKGFDPSHAVSLTGGALQDALKAGLARGQMTQTGYDAAMANYNDDVSNATNFANTFMQGRQADLSQKYEDITKAARAAQKADPNSFSWQDYLDQLNTARDTEKSAMGSSLQSALASNGFFSIPVAMTAAGRAQGAYNPPSSDDLLKALIGQTKGGGGGRGLGNQGAF